MLNFQVEKNFKKEYLPVLPVGSTYPYTFDTPIPFEIDLIYSARQISDGKIYQIDVKETGYFTGYSRGNAFSLPEMSIDSATNQIIANVNGGVFTNVTGYQREYLDGQQTADYPISSFNNFAIGNLSTQYYENFHLDISTTLPVIFRTQAESEYYTEGLVYWEENTGTHTFRNLTPESDFNIKAIYNAEEDEEVPEGTDFLLKIMWTVGEWTSNEQPPVNYVNWEGIRGRYYDGKLALYKIKGISDGHLKLGIKSTCSFFNLEYTTDGSTWSSTDSIPFEYFHRLRENELGEFGYALSMQNEYLPIFKNENDAEDYTDDLIPISEADNWDEISPNYPPENLTEEDDDETEMGEVYTRAFFSQQYICPVGALQEISNAFFDTDSGGITGIFDDIAKGLRMYGQDVSQAVQSCTFYPINLNEVFTDTMSQNYIYFGGYRFNLQNSSVNKIIHPNGYKYFGSFYFKSTFGSADKPSYRDYEPYQKLYVYLAYIGWQQLQISRYINKTVSVKYYFDTRTNGCLACLFADDVLVDYFNGQCGVSMPITLTSYTDYANAQIQTLLGMNNVSTGGAVGQLASGVGEGLVQSGAVSMGVVAGGLAMGGLAISGTKTLYGLTQNNINDFNHTKGASSSMLNQYLPQEILFMLEIQDSIDTPNEISLQGYPSNASGQLQSFSGYLEVDTVNLVCADATDSEKAEIIRQLQNGVYI